MKIGIDARIFKTGIGRYVQNLISNLAEIDSVNRYVIYLQKKDFDSFILPNERFSKVLADYPPYSFSEQFKFLIQLRKEKLDLLHFSNFNAPLLYPGRFCVTIHDLIHLSHSTFGSSTKSYVYYLFKKVVYRFAIWLLARRATRIIVPSKVTKGAIVHYLGIHEQKINVTYEGFDRVQITPSGENVLHKYGIRNAYMLYVATMYPHKNHTILLKLMEKLKADGDDTQLVLVGKVDYFSKQIREQVKQKGLEDRVTLTNFLAEDGYTSDADLAQLYQRAALYVFPSFAEGFGIPILEAQEYGIPVIASDIPIFREIANESVLYFDPTDVDDIYSVYKKIQSDNALRDQLIRSGAQNCKRFSWDTMARETLKIYNKLVS